MDRTLERRRPPLNRLPRWFLACVVGPPAVFLALFYGWPFATLMARGLDADAITATLGRTDTWRVLWFTTWQAVVSTALTIVIGLAPAWAVARYEFAGRRLLTSTLTAVFVLPTVVVGAAFVAILPDSLDRSVWAILGAHVVFNLAVVVRTVGAAWERIPADLEAAAATLGAAPWRSFVRVTLPLLRSAIAAAAAIVFLFTFTSFGVIRVLGTANRTTIEVEVWRRATQLGDIGGAATLALVQLGVLAVLVTWTSRQQRHHTHRFVIARDAVRRRPVGRERVGVAAAALGTAVLVAAPLVALVERSVRFEGGYSFAAWRSLGNQEIRPGLRLGVDPIGALERSAVTALWATLFALLIGATAVAAISALGRAGRVLDLDSVPVEEPCKCRELARISLIPRQHEVVRSFGATLLDLFPAEVVTELEDVGAVSRSGAEDRMHRRQLEGDDVTEAPFPARPRVGQIDTLLVLRQPFPPYRQLGRFDKNRGSRTAARRLGQEADDALVDRGLGRTGPVVVEEPVAGDPLESVCGHIVRQVRAEDG